MQTGKSIEFMLLKTFGNAVGPSFLCWPSLYNYPRPLPSHVFSSSHYSHWLILACGGSSPIILCLISVLHLGAESHVIGRWKITLLPAALVL